VGEWLRIQSQYEELMTRAGLDDLDRLLAGAGGERVRHSLHTNVYRVNVPPAGGSGRAFYVKAHRESWPNPRYLLRPSRPLREWRVLQRLRQRGIPAARPVAVGERRRWGALLDAVLVTEEVDDSIDLARFIPTFHQRPHTRQWLRQKRRYLAALARFTRAMHDAGYVSRDSHWRNILIAEGHEKPQSGLRPVRFFLIDNPRGIFLPWPAPARRLGVRDLAALDRRAPQYFTRTDRLRFLKTYVGAERVRACRRLLRRLSERRARQHTSAVPAQEGQRAAGPLTLVRGDGRWLVFREAAREVLVRLGALEPAALLGGQFDGEEIGHDARRTVLRLGAGDAASVVWLKRMAWDRLLRDRVGGLLEYGLALGPCGREWQNLLALDGLGLTAPRWLAFAQERAGGLVRREALVLEAVTDGVPVEEWQPGAAGVRGRRAFARELGRQLALAHGGGFCFREFPRGGLWVRPSETPRTLTGGDGLSAPAFEPVFVDVCRARRRRRLRRQDIVRDLSRLAASLNGLFSATDALRFLQAYRGRRATPEDKALVRAVLAEYQGLVRRKYGQAP